jgi:ubiquinol-cytochrome c reductase cytochrome b subunit
MWKKKEIIKIITNHLIDYPSPINITYFWSFGSLAGLCLVIQIITGIFLAMHYTPHIDYAFWSVEHIMRDVNNGWFLRYTHANGASMMFLMIYIHMFKNLYYGSYTAPRHWLWVSGVVILIATMATGFIGYVLPWGQMSFWGATVITNLFSAIPIVGNMIVNFLWGGFSVDNATLNRFFSLHYFLPFIIAALSIVHLIILHIHGNNNPIGIESKTSSISFYPYFYIKDLFSFFCFLIFFAFFVFFFPNLLGHSDNYIPANPMVTPPHIVPEWYFLPFYAILRSIPDKLGGVLAMFGSLLILLIIPFANPRVSIRSLLFLPISRKLFWFQVCNCVLLGWVGQKVVEHPYVLVGQIATAFYFLYFLILLPLTISFETRLIKWFAKKDREAIMEDFIKNKVKREKSIVFIDEAQGRLVVRSEYSIKLEDFNFFRNKRKISLKC